MAQGLYVHVPFCKSICNYCDFYRVVDLSLVGGYLEALQKECENISEKKSISTVYIGGGTPSSIGINNLEKLLEILHQQFYLNSVEEFTVECNPEDVTDDMLSILKNHGVNRISLGVQSLDDHVLKFMKRRHKAKKVNSVVEKIYTHGIYNTSVDLIYGLPQEANYNLLEDLHRFIDLGVEHISAYSLTYEENSIFNKKLQIGQLTQKDDDKVFSEYETVIDLMKLSGYEHYEISNFARPGKQSKHNNAYWKRIPYYGLGPSACSFDGKKRQRNMPDVEKFMVGTLTGFGYVPEIEDLTEIDVYNELVMLGLRTKNGVNIKEINSLGNNYAEYFIKNIEPFLIDHSVVKSENNFIIDERKWFICDLITSSLFITQ